MTSVVVHGITIPIGKGFQRVRTYTIPTSRTSGSGSGNNVSRLPPAVALAPQSEVELNEPAIRFVSKSQNDEMPSGGILTRRASRADEGEFTSWREGDLTVTESRDGAFVVTRDGTSS